MTILPFERASVPDASLSASRYGMRCATACFITRALLTTCGRNILPAPKRSPTTFMPSISGPSITSIGRPPRSEISARSSSVSDSACSSMPFTSACVIRSATGSDRQEPLGGVLAPVEYDVLDPLTELGVDLVVDDEGAGVDDAHVHPRLDGVVQEHGVDGLADRVVAAEREGHVRDAAGDQRAREVLLDPAGGLDVVDAVVGVLLYAGRHREDVGVEDDVLGGEPHLVHEDVVGPLADRLATLEVVGLAVLVERHHDHRGAVLAAQPGLLAALVLALLHRDGVD